MRSRVLLGVVGVLSAVVVSCSPPPPQAESRAPTFAPVVPAVPAPPPHVPVPFPLPPFSWDAIGEHPFARIPSTSPLELRSRIVRETCCHITADLRQLVYSPVVTDNGWVVLRGDVLSGREEKPEAVLPPLWTCDFPFTTPTASIKREWVKGPEKDAEERHGTRLFSPATPPGGTLLAEDVTDRDVMPMGVSADGRFAFVADGHVLAAWDTVALRRVHVLSPIETKPDLQPQGFKVIPSPDGRFVAVLEDGGCTPRQLRFCGNEPAIPPYHLSRGGPDRIRIWRTADWSVTWDYLNDGSFGHMWTADGRFVSRTYSVVRPSTSVTNPLTFRVEVRHPAGGQVDMRGGEVPADGRELEVIATADGRVAVAWPTADETGFTLHDLTAKHPPRRIATNSTVIAAAFTADTRFLLVTFKNWDTAIYDLCGVTTPPADYTAARLWDDLKTDDPLTVHRAVRWAIAHPAEAVTALKDGAEEGKPASARPFAASKLAEMIADPEPDSPATRRSWRAVYVLEQIGSPATFSLLRDWRNHLMPSSLTPQAYLSLRDGRPR